MIQETLCGFILDEVISPGGEHYAGLSSVIVTGETVEQGTTQGNKEESGKKDQASGSKEIKHPEAKRSKGSIRKQRENREAK